MSKGFTTVTYSILAAVSLLLSGCASIMNPNNYNIGVYSATPGADCTVVTKKGNEILFTGKTPCTVTLSPSHKDCIFKVNGQEREVCSTFSGWFDQGTGDFVLDISVPIHGFHNATAFANANNQKEFYWPHGKKSFPAQLIEDVKMGSF